MFLKRKGWVLSDNVVISIHGVKKNWRRESLLRR